MLGLLPETRWYEHLGQGVEVKFDSGDVELFVDIPLHIDLQRFLLTYSSGV